MTHPGKIALQNIVRGLLGVTAGPWKRVESKDNVPITYLCDEAGRAVVKVPWHRGVSGNAHRDAGYIELCNPEEMRKIAAYVADLERRLEAADAVELTHSQQFILEWLGKEDSSSFGECKGEDLDALIKAGFAFVGKDELEGSQDWAPVSLTEAGRTFLSSIKDNTDV